MANIERLSDNPITHAGVRPMLNRELNSMVNGQSAVRYLRFGHDVCLDRLELPPVAWGRHAPCVPTHPEHVIISVLDRDTNHWRTIREVSFPRDSRISGDALSQEMTLDQMDEHFQAVLQDPPKVIPMDGLVTDHLRVECDLEHPVWPSHGEMNGGSGVPFGILDSLQAYGIPGNGQGIQFEHRPILKLTDFAPSAPAGMKVVDRPDMLMFEGEQLSVGFSLRRPLIMHLGFDASGSGRASQNRISATNTLGIPPLSSGFLSAPVLRTFDVDYRHDLWTGEVSVVGNRVTYSSLIALDGLTLDATFTIESDRITVELTQSCRRAIPVIEAEAWRIVWDERAGTTAAAALPTLKPGRNGDVQLPFLWAGAGVGCLSCRLVDGDPHRSRVQVESYRPNYCVTGGFVLGEPAGSDTCQVIPSGPHSATFELAVTNLEPQSDKVVGPSDAIKRHWASVFSCFRPELGGFSNNSLSINCHVNQGTPLEVIARTRKPDIGPDPLDLAKFTVGRALMNGSGYGYWRNLYMDADPILVSSVGRIHQVEPDSEWLSKIEPGLTIALRRILGTIGGEGLAICKDLSGNSGSYRWSSNAMDVVGFGHMDAYVNAWTYRALRNGAALAAILGHTDLAVSCREAADGIRQAYSTQLLNPETGWVAGWRSRDGVLHDYAFTWVNGPAIAFGLLEPGDARKALCGLERLRDEIGMGDARMGLPVNLLPINPEDHMLPRLLGATYPTFERYTDGSLGPFPVIYYLRALSIYGLSDRAAKLANDMAAGYEADMFTGGMGAGYEFRGWDGVPNGYEGTLILCLSSLYAIAVEQGIIEPLEPEWWPEA